MKNKKLVAILTLVCFMLTLMPIAAFATEYTVPDGVDYQESSVFTADEDASEDVGDVVDINFEFVNAKGKTVDITTGNVYVWFVKDGADVATTSVVDEDGNAGDNGVFTIVNPKSGVDYGFIFNNSGEYTVKAAFAKPEKATGDTWAEAFADVEYKLGSVANHKVIEITSSSSSSDYGISIKGSSYAVDVEDWGDQSDEWEDETYIGDDGEATLKGVSANGVAVEEYTVKLVDENGKVVKGEKIELDTNSSNIELNKDSATTDQLGQIKFKVAGIKDGDYKVYLRTGSFEVTLNVEVGGVGAAVIKVVKSPSAPFDPSDDMGDKIQFTFTDANGNAVKAWKAAVAGATMAFNSSDNGGYISIVSQPSASDLDDEDFFLVEDDDNEYRANLALSNNADDLEEGSYTLKIVLDSGKYVNVSFEVQEFGTPVALNLEYDAEAVEVGGSIELDTLEWVDAAGVTKDCTSKVDLAASGYAIKNFDSETGKITVKDDRDYVGEKITVVAVDDRYNLTAQVVLTVADEATELKFDTKTLAVDANNKVGVTVVDGEGNRVALDSSALEADITYVVLDKPAGAKVSVATDGADNDVLDEGTFVMNVTSNTAGNVTIQALVKVVYAEENKTATKYYTGTQTFVVGASATAATSKTVVMSIGSNSVIVDNAVAGIDAAPMIQDGRTFVPFRALAEAFGATVNYDAATQAVTAELNGVTVIMTIGSDVYTVNGSAKTADVAPFINGARTMVPVRFVAEAFGITVTPIYDASGATADVLFTM